MNNKPCFRCPKRKEGFCNAAATGELFRLDETDPHVCQGNPADENCRQELEPVREGLPTWVMYGIAAVLVVIFGGFALRGCGAQRPKYVVPTPRPAGTPKPVVVVATPTPAPLATPTPVPAPASFAGTVLLRLQAPRPLAEDVISRVAAGYLSAEGLVGVRQLPGRDAEHFVVAGRRNGETTDSGIEIESASPDSDLESLAKGNDAVFASREPKQRESAALSALGDFGAKNSDATRKLIGRDGVAVLVHKNNSVKDLSTAQVTSILDGRVTDWSQIGGQSGPIHLHLPKEASAFLSQVRSTLDAALPALRIPQLPGSKRHERGGDLVAAVASDPQGFGLSLLRHAGVTGGSQPIAKILPIADEGAIRRLLPSAFTVGLEDYAFRARVVLYHAAAPANPHTMKFAAFATGLEGQRLVASAGLVDLDLRPVERSLPSEYLPYLPRELQGRVGRTAQLPVNFRFATNTAKLNFNDLDFAAQDALVRVVKTVAAPDLRGRHIFLFGFTDAVGTDEYNIKLAMDRAAGIQGQLEQRAVPNIHPVGLGRQLPVATNDTDEGKAQNRRVEVWIAEVK